MASTLMTGASAVSAQDTSPQSNESDQPAIVTGLRSTYSEAFSTVLNWNRAPRADGYAIRMGGADFSPSYSTNVWHVERYLQGDTTYSFEVAAYIVVDGAFVVGEYGAVLEVRTPLAELRKPTIFLDRRWGAIPVDNDSVRLSLAVHRPVINAYHWYRDGMLMEFDNRTQYDGSVVQGSTYLYQVQEVRSDGQLGPLSEPMSITIPGTPPGVPLPAPNVNQKRVEPRLAVFFVGSGPASAGNPGLNGAEYHEIWRDGELIVESINGWWVDKRLTPETTYQYQFRAIAVDGTKGEWTPIAVTTLARR